MLRPLSFTFALALPFIAMPALAQEIFGGVYLHAVDTPLSLDTGEHGTDIEAGYRFAPIEGLAVIGKPAPYVIATVNTAGDTALRAWG